MLTYFVIAPILVAIFLYLFPAERLRQFVVFFAQGALLIAAFYLLRVTGEGEVITRVGNYTGFLGITLRADRLSAVFVLLTTFLFLIVSVYSFDEKRSRLFWFLLFVWEGTFIGLFLTRDLFNIFVLAEVASIVVAVLLMYNRGRRCTYHGTVYLIVNVIVMQFFLLGLGYLYRLTGALDMAYSAQIIASLDPAQLVLPYALIITAIAAKCTLLPMFTFLPKVSSIPRAPASVAAILSGLQVKSGLYLFLRFRHMFVGIDATALFLAIGIVTAVFGVIFALIQKDLKRMLAYSTIAQIGLIFIGLHLDAPGAYIGSMYHILSHAIAKSALFLGAGVITTVYNTRDVSEIRGVFRRMPVIGAATGLAILAIMGAPLFSGSISKYFIMAEAPLPLYIVMILINLGTVTIFIKYAAMLFGRPKVALPERKVALFQQAPILILGIFCLLGGLFGTQAIGWLFQTPVSLSPAGYIEKIIILALSGAVGYLLFKRFPRDLAPINALRQLNLGFRGICVSIGGFFALVLVVMGFLS